ncbi:MULTISPECIES: phage tail tape measure protein [unclassified Gemella]|uniref:phage tail tape measure protein n=1 Tax=unclassified Gemella TaxID=2624949 RepID=UPI0015D08F5E|nr:MULTISPECIES: phage tail tape measure protein [unclassified Gemella]MBF0710460.1 phage tail tape measure protein [Gemella sp. GL1.1]NYS27804.1 phage tail tape measure protein [Gemella sp. GL1]
MANRLKGITIEIGGDTTKLSESFKKVNKDIRDTQSQLRDVNKLLKLDPVNSDLVIQKQNLLKDAVEKTKLKLDSLKQASIEANSALEKGTLSKEHYDAIQREIVETENSLKNLKQELNNTNNKWQETGQKVQGLGEKMTGIGNTLTTNVTTPILAVATASTMAFNEVDKGLDTVISKTGATGESADKLEESFRKVAGNLPATFDEVGAAIGEVNTQFGVLGEDLEVATEKIIKFSQINNTDVTNSTIMAKQAIEKYNLSVNDLGMVLDSVTKTAQNTGVSTDRLFTLITNGSPQIKELGLNFAQGAELLGRLEQKGYDGSKALTYLAKAQINWAKDNMSLTDGLKNLEDRINSAATSEEKLTIAAEVFGTKGASFMLKALESGALSADGFKNAMEEAGGALENTWQGMLDSIDLTNQAMNNLKLTGADLGAALQTVLLPTLQVILGALKGFADWFGSLSPGVQEFIVQIALLVAVLGPVISFIGGITSGIGSIITAWPQITAAFTAVSTFLTGTLVPAISGFVAAIGWIPLAIAGVIAALVLLWNKSEWFRTTIIGIWESIKTAFQISIDFIVNLLTTSWDFISEKTNIVFTFISTLFKTIWTNIKTTIEFVLVAISTYIFTKFEEIRNTISTILNLISSVFNTVWNFIKNMIVSITSQILNNIVSGWTNIKNRVVNLINNIKDSGINIFNNFRNGVSSIINSIANVISSGFNSAVNYIRNLISQAYTWGYDLISGIVNGIYSTIGKVRDAVSSVAKTIWSYLHFSVPEVGPLTEYETWMPDFMDGLAKGINKNKGKVIDSIRDLASSMTLDYKVASFDFDKTNKIGLRPEIEGSKNTNQNIVIPVYLGNKMLDEVIVEANARMNLRRGGR